MFVIDVSQGGPIRNAWINYIISHGVSKSPSDSDYDEESRLFWEKIGQEFGIVDIPNCSKIGFENEEAISHFILKYGTINR